MEYGFDDKLPNYSGGLGILAGDHLRTTDKINYPILAFGLYYKYGYFNQKIDDNGWQKEEYVKIDLDNYTHEKVDYSNYVELPEGKLHFNIIKVKFGKTDLLLLTTDCEQNNVEFRKITDKLYGGTRRNRLRQELLLGIGSIKYLNDIHAKLNKIHINEGHATFAYLQKAINLSKTEDIGLKDAFKRCGTSNIFTTHTPVIHGNETFNSNLVKEHLKCFDFNDKEIEYILKMGLHKNKNEFSLPAFAIRNSKFTNAVSILHSKTANEMWKDVIESPILPITNGIDLDFWKIIDVSNLDKISFFKIKNKEKLKLQNYLSKRYNLDIDLESKFIMSFARRFAPYKRANLLFKNLPKLKEFFFNEGKDTILFIAGKAHPHDIDGKEIIQEIVRKIKIAGLQNHVFLLDNYDIELSKNLLASSDIWLNTPLKPMEACGTSGMKAALNGTVNLSIKDGWWEEAFNGNNGYEIPDMEDLSDEKQAGRIIEIIKTIHSDKGNTGKWFEIAKNAYDTILKSFDSKRMLRDYIELYDELD